MEQEVTTVPQESHEAEIAAAIAEADTNPQMGDEQAGIEGEAAQETPKPEPRKLKVKHLHEEKEITEDEAIPLIQKGMDYDRVKTQSEQLMEDRKFIEGLAKEYGMDAATLKSELAKAARASKMQELTEKGVPVDVAEEVIEARKYREELKARETQAQAEARRRQEASDFLKEYPDVKPTDIPASVWQEVEAGIPLIHAYARHDATSLRAQLQKYATVGAVAQKSASNAAAAPGGISGAPAVESDYISPEAFERMTQREAMQNWDKIQKSMKKWK